MTTTTAGAPERRRPSRAGVIGLLVAVVVVVIAAFNVKVIAVGDLEPTESFDPATFAAENYASEIVPQIEAEAVDLATLLDDLAAGADPADFGNTSGAGSAFAFPVTFTAVAGTPAPPALPLTVEGVPSEVSVQLQIGPGHQRHGDSRRHRDDLVQSVRQPARVPGSRYRAQQPGAGHGALDDRPGVARGQDASASRAPSSGSIPASSPSSR